MKTGFTKSEMAALMKAFSRGMSGKYTRRDYQALMAWAKDARAHGDFLELVLEGKLDPYVEDGVVRFTATEVGLASDRRDELERIRI